MRYYKDQTGKILEESKVKDFTKVVLIEKKENELAIDEFKYPKSPKRIRIVKELIFLEKQNLEFDHEESERLKQIELAMIVCPSYTDFKRYLKEIKKELIKINYKK